MTIGADDAAIAALASRIMGEIPAIIDRAGKRMDAFQQEKLTSHMQAMARRSLTGERLPEFDKSLFDEISPPARLLSEEVTALFGNLPEEEALLLSIHFETMPDKA